MMIGENATRAIQPSEAPLREQRRSMAAHKGLPAKVRVGAVTMAQRQAGNEAHGHYFGAFHFECEQQTCVEKKHRKTPRVLSG